MNLVLRLSSLEMELVSRVLFLDESFCVSLGVNAIG